jgi:hypothetical protein
MHFSTSAGTDHVPIREVNRKRTRGGEVRTTGDSAGKYKMPRISRFLQVP